MKTKNEELTIIQAEEFGVDAVKAKNIEYSFLPKKTEIDAYAEQYSEIIKLELNPDTFKKARELRLKLVKVRTGIAEVHKAEKAFFLASGKYVDALKNKLTAPIEQMEAKLREIEDTEKRLEQERKEKLRLERIALLEPYGADVSFLPLAEMTEEQFQGQLGLAKAAYEKRQEEERLAKEELERQERILELERKRKELLTPFYSFVSDWSDLGEKTEEEFNSILESSKKAKEDYEAEQAKIKAENEKLKAEEDRKNKLESERKKQLSDYQAFVDWSSVDLKTMDEKAFSELVESSKTLKAEHDAEQAKIKAEAQRLQKIADELAKEKADREEKERKERERIKALENAGDQVKFKEFYNQFKEFKFPELNNKEVTSLINGKLDELRKFMVEQSKKLV